MNNQAAQSHFDFILGVSNRELLRVDEVARRLGVERDYVYTLLADGSLEAHRRPGVERSTALITKRSVLAWLAKSATYEPADFVSTLADLANGLKPEQRAELRKRLKN